MFISLDWFNAAANVFNAAGRVSLAGGVQNVGVNPAGAFFATDVVLANSAVNVTSVDFYYAGSGTSPNLNNTNSNGRAVILHAGRGNVGNAATSTDRFHHTPNSPDATQRTTGTGNAGDRIACGQIAVRRR